MTGAAPQIFVALEGSGLGLAIRNSVWAYPIANILHVVALTIFAGAITVMDLRLAGVFAATRPADVVVPARRVVLAALAVLMLTGLVLFTAEASHVVLNPVFLIKAALIACGVFNAIIFGQIPAADLAALKPGEALPNRVRRAAYASLAIWLSVALCGRMVAYV